MESLADGRVAAGAGADRVDASSLMLNCPNCANVIGEYPDASVAIVACAHCTFKYELSAGTCTSLRSHLVEVRRAVLDGPALHMRRFELSVATSSRETLRFTFDTDRDDEWIHIATGDRVVVAYSMRADTREELLFVVNRTRGERFVLGKPGQRSKSRAMLFGTLAAAVGGTTAAVLSAPFLLAAGVALLAGVATTKGLGYALRPKHVLAAHEQVELTARSELLIQKRSLRESRGVVLNDIENRRSLAERLHRLRSRMIAVRLDAYATRIADTDRALQALDEQRQMDDRLLAEYDRTLQILDIEYESSVAAETLPSDAAGIMDSRLAELRVVEELRADVTRRLAANDEVEQLLRSNSG